MKAARLISSAFVIARRDFTATIFSKAFLLFLLGPLFPILVGVLFGGIGAKVAGEAERPVIAVIAQPAEFARLAAAREEVAQALGDMPVVTLARHQPQTDEPAQRQRLLETGEPPARGVLTGGLAAPRFTGAAAEDGTIIGQLRLIVATAQRPQADAGRPLQITLLDQSAGSTATGRTLTARAAQALLFLLTLLLAGMLLSQLIEEKSNKVIEVLAAAVPVDAIFLGKLFAMLAMSLVGITVWASAAATAVLILAPGAFAQLPAPAVGWPPFAFLCLLYFAMSYLLIGAAFLGIGAQASTVREVQTLSMPVTMAQVFIFALASDAVDNMDGRAGIAATLFPLSSPFAMVARAAQSDSIWPHLAALLWQALWVGLILRFASGLFRRSVLKSGGAPWRKRRRTAASAGSSAAQ